MRSALYKEWNAAPDLVSGMAENCEGSILKVLAYFDIFMYPLTRKEILQFLDQPISEFECDNALHRLMDQKAIFRINELYTLQNDLLPIARRRKGNLRANMLLPRAHRIGRFLYQFPFVRAIGISGSLSKQFADEKADIDFFIITRANRLWIARTIMHVFKKFTFLAGRQHWFCMNYYVDEKALLVDDHNIFTAIEIKTLLPVCGGTMLDDFFAMNSWSDQFLPLFNRRSIHKPEHHSGTWFKSALEWIFGGRFGNWLDDRLMNITSRRWKKKEKMGKRNKKGLTMGLVTGKHYAWSNPESFREKVLARYDEKITALKLKLPGSFALVNLSFEE